MENSLASNTLPSLPIDELTIYHSLLIEKVDDPELNHINEHTSILMPFNGYYALEDTTGAFFAVDTNMLIKPGHDPKYNLSLLISLDGVTSKRFPFTGTFDGTSLIQKSHGVTIDLTFTRTNTVYGTTATLTGSITLSGQPAKTVSGATYNNPIPASVFIGDYSYIPKGKTEAIKVMSIGANNKLMYDNGNNNGNLVVVQTYVYNLNMYFFSFNQGDSKVQLIMGTAATKGFACNDMSVKGSKLVSRSLVTIPDANQPSPQAYDLSGIQLADFSGYYQIPTKEHPLAFVSIQAQYATLSEQLKLDLNFVMISYSFDGITSTGFMFDPFASMTFDNTTNILTVPASGTQQEISLAFTRSYNPKSGSLVNVTGTIGNQKIEGSTLFNPVPLSAFGGVTMTSPDGTEKLIINNDNSITYSENSGSPTTINNIIYVPLMYIVAAPSTDPTIVLSLGTNGLRGLACIVVNNPSTVSKTTAVYAINGPE